MIHLSVFFFFNIIQEVATISEIVRYSTTYSFETASTHLRLQKESTFPDNYIICVPIVFTILLQWFFRTQIAFFL